MQEILKLQKKIIPELVELLEKRYNILSTIYYNQPIGRRILANKLNLGERVVRTEINFFKEQGLIEIHTPGMTVTKDGEKIVNELKEFIHDIRGLSEVEEQVKSLLNIRKVIIVPGDIEKDPQIVKDLGKASAKYLKEVIKDNSIIALTGGSTIKEVVEAFPKVNFSNVLVVPARGGMGRNVETQSNTLAASLAKKVNGTYKMLHIPENLSDDILETLLKKKNISEVVDCIRKADILLYGIGNAEHMAQKRGAEDSEIMKLIDLGAIGEAFGCYFNKKGEVVFRTAIVGLDINEARKIKTHIAVAGGKNKVSSIISTQLNNSNSILVTDEAAGKQIVRILSENIK
ncbi:MAG: sugar-binding transcriptional regulator [Clostridium sp.]|nr:sugar-binding transcriptional regulator [Clostridium sp.]